MYTCCPDCETPNQFGELCAECRTDRQAMMRADFDRTHPDDEPTDEEMDWLELGSEDFDNTESCLMRESMES